MRVCNAHASISLWSIRNISIKLLLLIINYYFLCSTWNPFLSATKVIGEICTQAKHAMYVDGLVAHLSSNVVANSRLKIVFLVLFPWTRNFTPLCLTLPKAAA